MNDTVQEFVDFMIFKSKNRRHSECFWTKLKPFHIMFLIFHQGSIFSPGHYVPSPEEGGILENEEYYIPPFFRQGNATNINNNKSKAGILPVNIGNLDMNY